MSYSPRTAEIELARVLLVDDDPRSRLTLKTLLEAGGYSVDVAASAAEAVGKLDDGEFDLVLSDMQMESPEAGRRVLAHAKAMDYKPATALVTAETTGTSRKQGPVLIEPENVPELLGKIADLISERASKRLRRQLRRKATPQFHAARA